MVSVILSIDEYIIMYGQYSWALGYDVIHSHLKDILAHFESKWYIKKCVECCEEWSCLCQVHSEEGLVAIHLRIFGCSAPVSTWAISSRVGALWFSRMMALLKSFGSRHILNLPFAFLGYGRELTHGVGCLFGNDSLIYHLSQLFFDLLLLLDGNFPSSMLDWKDCRDCLDVILSWHVTYAVEAVGEQHLEDPWYCWWK